MKKGIITAVMLAVLLGAGIRAGAEGLAKQGAEKQENLRDAPENNFDIKEENGTSVEETGLTGEESQARMDESMEAYLDQLEFDEIDQVLNQKEDTAELDFSSLVEKIIQGEEADKGWLVRQILDTVFKEVREFKSELLQIILLCVVFAILYNFANVFENAAVSEISFYMVYMLLLVLLMRSFFILQEVAGTVMDDMLVFLQTLIPTFAMSMAFSGQFVTAAGFYELTFFLIYGIEWIMMYLVLPAIQIYVILELMNYLTEEEMLSRMTELLKAGVEWVMKVLFTMVIGINVVQSLLTPAIDSFKTGLVTKTAGLLPGLGTSINAVAEIMVGAGIIIKNGVGVAAVVVLLIMCAGPLVKVWVMTFLYKLLAAVIQPVADKRMTGCISGAGEGGRLIGKVIMTTTVMFLVSIAMVTAATTFNQ